MENKIKSYLNVLKWLGVYIYRLIDFKVAYVTHSVKEFWGCSK